jgi:transaldolase
VKIDALRKLVEEGQSIWLDYFGRRFIDSGRLRDLIADAYVTGVTSNPTLFEKAIAAGEYDEGIVALARHGHRSETIFEALAVEDVQRAADLLHFIHAREGGQDGFVSYELPPGLAHDAHNSISEGRRLFKRLDRPNVMIKVPATTEGVEAIRALTASGVNVNVTLIFSLWRYREVLDAYLSGLEDRLAAGLQIERIASVASFFLSRIDTVVDQRLIGQSASAAASLRGKAAIANARLAYQEHHRVMITDRARELGRAGARPQRLLWASTSTKDPTYRDVMYVEELIGPGTINTMPMTTLEAFADHGAVGGRTIEEGLAVAQEVFARLENLGIDLETVGVELEEDGVKKFRDSWDSLIRRVGERQATVSTLGPEPPHPWQ